MLQHELQQLHWKNSLRRAGRRRFELVDRIFSNKTNADRIRAMSDEQMAKDLINMIMELCEDGVPCEEFALDWFRRPAEED